MLGHLFTFSVCAWSCLLERSSWLPSTSLQLQQEAMLQRKHRLDPRQQEQMPCVELPRQQWTRSSSPPICSMYLLFLGMRGLVFTDPGPQPGPRATGVLALASTARTVSTAGSGSSTRSELLNMGTQISVQTNQLLFSRTVEDLPLISSHILVPEITGEIACFKMSDHLKNVQGKYN